jgi:hypothetical protein
MTLNCRAYIDLNLPELVPYGPQLLITFRRIYKFSIHMAQTRLGKRSRTTHAGSCTDWHRTRMLNFSLISHKGPLFDPEYNSSTSLPSSLGERSNARKTIRVAWGKVLVLEWVTKASLLSSGGSFGSSAPPSSRKKLGRGCTHLLHRGPKPA